MCSLIAVIILHSCIIYLPPTNEKDGELNENDEKDADAVRVKNEETLEKHEIQFSGHAKENGPKA